MTTTRPGPDADEFAGGTPAGAADPATDGHAAEPPDFSISLTSDTRATLVVLVATCCAVTPLQALFRDSEWILGVWGAIALILVPAAALRMRWRAHVSHVLPGLALCICYLTAGYLPTHALGGVIPSSGYRGDLAALGEDLGIYIRDTVAPSASIPAALFVVSVVFAAVAIFSDAIAVVFREGALLAAPYLLILTVSASVPREPVPWWSFVLVAGGYLLVLAEDSRNGHRRWGPVMIGRDPGRRVRGVGSNALRIGVVAIVAALVLAALLPSDTRNALSNAVHNGSSTDSGTGGGGTSLDPFASLKGQLSRGAPVSLFTVTATNGVNPYYLRQIVLDDFTGSRWQQNGDQQTAPLRATTLPLIPDDAPADPQVYDASVSVTGLVGNAPTLQAASTIRGLPRATSWNSRTAIVGGPDVEKGDRYTVSVRAPRPTIEQLSAVDDVADPLNSPVARNLQLPSGLPAEIRTRTANVTDGASGPYAKARAIQNYFTTPSNGFVYTLSTKLGDSGNDLVDFLTNKQGFCQQYAAAMAVMLRVSGVPARVVLGYTHEPARANGDFEVTTSDAHAWVEAYLTGYGWTAFDPTPLGGVDANRAQPLAYVPRAGAQAAATPAPRSGASASAAAAKPTESTTEQSSSGGTSKRPLFGGALPTTVGWLLVVVAVLLAIGAIPGLIRLAQRRRRLRAAHTLGVDPLWEELAETARDLGYVWSPSRSPRQVTALLQPELADADAAQSLRELSRAVERSRYSRPGPDSDGAADARRTDLIDELRSVEDGLRGNRSRWQRLRARALPSRALQTGMTDPLAKLRRRFSSRRSGA